MMPSVLEEVFKESGRNIKDYIPMTEIDPLYTLKFGDIAFKPSRNHQETYEEIERLFPGNGDGYWRFLKREKKKFDVISDLLRKPFGSLTDYMSKEAITALPHLDAFETVYGCLYTPVKRVLVEDKKAIGVELVGGEKKYCDDVVINAGFGYAMTQLFDQKDLKNIKKAS
ncbi:MAG: phytoene desaturase family protein [Bacillota bacterium]